MKPEQVESCLDIGREALVQFAEMTAAGRGTRGDIFLKARAERDALVCLLDELPLEEHEPLNLLIDRYDAFMASLVN